MKKYIAPEFEVSVFTSSNIIATSFGLDGSNAISNPNDVCARKRGYDDFDEDDF